MVPSHIHPIFDTMLSRSEREKQLGQHSCVIWMTGLSGSGKSTIGRALERKLSEKGFFAQLLDGDNIRSGINKDLGFTDEDRSENIRRIAEIANLYKESGIISIVSFISPTILARSMAKEIVNSQDFIEVFINTTIEVCEERDVKGLYKKARAGLIKDFTGIDAPYEPPINPDIEINTIGKSISSCTEEILDFISPRIKR